MTTGPAVLTSSGCPLNPIMSGDATNMPVIGAAATTNHTNVWEQFQECCIQLAEFFRVAVIQRFRLIQFCVAKTGSIGPKPANAPVEMAAKIGSIRAISKTRGIRSALRDTKVTAMAVLMVKRAPILR